VRLAWNEIRHRATRFAQEWKDAHYEKGETQTFYNEFFEIFGIQRRKVATFEEPIKRAGAKAPGFIDLFWKGTLLVEQKSAGRDLTKAKQQALDYFPGIKDSELPRYVLVCDFQTFDPHRPYQRSHSLHGTCENCEAAKGSINKEWRRLRDGDSAVRMAGRRSDS
jgi:hypothetical protein